MIRIRRGMLAVTLVAAATGCGKFRDMVEGVVAMQRCLALRAGTNSVSIGQSGKRLTLTLANSALDTLPAEPRTAAARQIALCARDNYPMYERLTEVAVVFSTRAGTGVAKVVSTSGAPLVFATRDLGAKPALPADSGAAKAPAKP